MVVADVWGVAEVVGARVRKYVVESPLLVDPHHWPSFGRNRWNVSFLAIGELGSVFSFVEVLNEQFDNLWVIFWKVDLGVCSFLTRCQPAAIALESR